MMDENEYNEELKKKHFGRSTPIDFPGYNTPTFYKFPYWTSDETTYAAVILALTECQYLFPQ